jgi:hypothetical protein
MCFLRLAHRTDFWRPALFNATMAFHRRVSGAEFAYMPAGETACPTKSRLKGRLQNWRPHKDDGALSVRLF